MLLCKTCLHGKESCGFGFSWNRTTKAQQLATLVAWSIMATKGRNLLSKSRICCPGEENLPQSESADAIECCVALKDLVPNEHLITNLLLNVANFSNLNRAQRILVYVLRLLQIKVLSKISTNNKFVQFIKDHISKTGKIRSYLRSYFKTRGPTSLSFRNWKWLRSEPKSNYFG